MPKPRIPRCEVTQPSDQSYRLIALTQNQVTKVDATKYEQLNQFNWFAYWDPCSMSFYARRAKWNPGRKRQRIVEMAGEILQLKTNEHPDHKNHDTLDNRRENLRKATKSQNMMNRRMKRDNTSGYIGVHWHLGKWQARITSNGKRISLGHFFSIEKADRAYDEAAKKLYGEFAVLNFP